MARQTQQALARRAIEAAEFMEGCARWIHDEAVEQNVPWFTNATDTVTLNAVKLGNIVYAMRGLPSRIRELEANLTREKIRGRGHP